MEVFTEITTKVTSVKTISLTSKDILELMLSKGIISDEKYQHEAEVFVDDGMKQYKRHINGIIVDHVDFPSGMNKKQIRKALLSQGYDSKIRVRKN